MIDKWYDVQDEDGVWRVGECFFEDKQGTKTIGFDGFHPNYTTTFCKHSTKILPIRTKTNGLTIPQDRRPLRQVLTQLQLQNVSGRINLYLMKSNYLQFQPKLIKSSIRTQFLILVDKIVTTPFQIIRQIKQLDPNITNFFINVLSIYTRVMQFSKTFMSMIETNQTAQELYYAIYQLTAMANIIFGLHPHSTQFYGHKLNISIKSSGFIDFFVLSDSGLLLFRNFFKGATTIKKPTDFDYQISQTVANLVLELCQKMKNYLVDGTYQSKTVLVLDEIITNLRHMCEQNQNLRSKINNNLLLISKIQSLYFKLRSNKACPLRKYISKQQPKQQKHVQPTIQLPLSIQKNGKEEQISKLEERIKKLEILITSQQQEKSHSAAGEEFRDAFKFQRPNLPIQNLGEEMFLGSLEWALETGDVQTAKKLTKWRRSLLSVGRITGWEVALAIGSRTYKKQQITAADIIQANYEYLTKQKKQ